MRAPAVPLRYKLIALCAAGLLACGVAPLVGFAEESVAGGFMPPGYEGDAQGASPNNSDGWLSSAMRERLSGKRADGSISATSPTFWGYLPADVQGAIVGVTKYQQRCGGTTASYLQKTTHETVWLPSLYEVHGASFTYHNESEALRTNGNVPFQYMAYQPGGTNQYKAKTIKAFNGVTVICWLRSAHQENIKRFCRLNANGDRSSAIASNSHGIAPAFCL